MLIQNATQPATIGTSLSVRKITLVESNTRIPTPAPVPIPLEAKPSALTVSRKRGLADSYPRLIEKAIHDCSEAATLSQIMSWMVNNSHCAAKNTDTAKPQPIPDDLQDSLTPPGVDTAKPKLKKWSTADNSIRHTLSMKECFINKEITDRNHSRFGKKSGIWEYDPNAKGANKCRAPSISPVSVHLIETHSTEASEVVSFTPAPIICPAAKKNRLASCTSEPLLQSTPSEMFTQCSSAGKQQILNLLDLVGKDDPPG